MSRIACILPKGEGFSPEQFGAIALCVRDFTLHSRYCDNTQVLGGVSAKGFDGVHYLTVPPARWFENRTRAYARGCARIIHERQCALVEVHNRPHLLQLLVGKISARLALHLHNDPQEMKAAVTPNQRMRLLSHCAAVYCVSDFIRERFAEGVPQHLRTKLHVIHNGLALPPAPPAKEKLIVFAGRLTEGKGALLLAQALRIALPQLEGWQAVLIGSRRHRAAQKREAHELAIFDMLAPLPQVECTGFLSHEKTMLFFSRAAIAVVPSVWQEPFGRTALEAMAQGCAVISSGRGALREVTGAAALTLASLTPETLAQALLQLARNEAERTHLQQHARERAKQFDIATCTQALDDVRAQILGG